MFTTALYIGIAITLFFAYIFLLVGKSYKETLKLVITGFIITIIIIGLIYLTKTLDTKFIKTELLKEIPTVDTSDNLRGYLRNDSLIIEFKNKRYIHIQ